MSPERESLGGRASRRAMPPAAQPELRPPIDQEARRATATQLDTTFFVEAAAGTGKTTALVARILTAVTSGRARLYEIVAITFTEKAAGELKLRLREELEKKVTGAALRQALSDLERAPITTIHSFCASLLRERPVEARLDPQFAVADNLQQQLLLDEAWANWLESELTKNPAALRQALMREIGIPQLKELATLLIEQRSRLTDQPWPALCPADPQSIRRELEAAAPVLERCLKHNVAPAETFYQRVKSFLDVLPQLATASAERAAALLSAVELSEPKRKADFDSPAVFIETKATIKELKAVIADYTAATEHNFLVELAGWLTGFVGHFQQYKNSQAVLDFDDLLEQTRDLLRGPAIRQEFQDRYKFLLVDEFQDTDPVQNEIVLALGGDTPGKLFIVGDPKQSIYGFRRADIEMYAGTRQQLGATGQVVQFQRNFRSQANIIDWVNSVFAKMFQPTSYQPHYIELEASHPAAGKITLLRPASIPEKQSIDAARRAEATAIARYLHRQQIPWNDVALLFRSFTGVEVFAEVFLETSVPFRIIGGRGYYQRQEIQTLIALLCCLDNPNDKLNLIAVLRSPLFGWSDEQILLANEAGGLSYLRADNPTFRLLRELHDARHQFSVAGFVEQVFARTHLCQACFSVSADGQASVANLLKALELARQVEAAGIRSLRGFVRQLRQTVMAGMDEEPAPAHEDQAPAVQLLSMHKSKGLEFPVVILADLAGKSSDSGARLVPDRAAQNFQLRFAGCKTTGFEPAVGEQDLRDEAEEIRLLYVAATRARRQLIIPWFAEKGERLDLLKRGFELGESAVVEIIGDLPAVVVGEPAAADVRTFNRAAWQAERTALLERAGKSALRVSPSKLEAEDEPTGVARERAMEIGTLVHAALERLDATGLTDDAKTWVERALRSPLLTRAGQADEVYRELPFADGTLEGRIDLLFREQSRWVLVDYKTDVTQEALQYQAQLRAYREALNKTAGIAVEELLVFFLRTGDVVNVT